MTIWKGFRVILAMVVSALAGCAETPTGADTLVVGIESVEPIENVLEIRFSVTNPGARSVCLYLGRESYRGDPQGPIDPERLEDFVGVGFEPASAHDGLIVDPVWAFEDGRFLERAWVRVSPGQVLTRSVRTFPQEGRLDAVWVVLGADSLGGTQVNLGHCGLGGVVEARPERFESAPFALGD